MILKRTIGDVGEKAAAKFLAKRGYRILERNFLCRLGEIDIIAQQGEYLVFVEVKTRKSHAYGGGEGAITNRKIECIKRAAQTYIMSKGIDAPVRFDVVTVYGDGATDKPKNFEIEVIENAF